MNRYSNFKNTGTTTPSNPFEKERLENAAKREQREQRGGQNRAMTNGSGGRATPRGLHSNRQMRFTDNKPVEKENQSPVTTNPFATANATPSAFGTPSTASFNPFALATKKEPPANPFGAPSAVNNPFGAPSQPSTNFFGKPSGPLSQSPLPNGFQNSSSSIFGAPSKPSSVSPFDRTSSSTNGTQVGSNSLNPFSSRPTSNPSGGPSPSSLSNYAVSTSTPSGVVVSSSPAPSSFGAFTSTTMANGFKPSTNSPAETTIATPNASNVGPTSSSALAQKMDTLLRKQGINPPAWPTTTPGDPKQKSAVEAFWQSSKGYRSKVRASLIKAGLLDDPDKPKKLSEAIDFKGTCEDMCPEFEKITRIMEHDVQGPEKEVAPDGSLWPSPQKMVKALARSAAGQDAPLPMDVRSPAALRRTLDYLLHTVLGDDGNLPAIHGFLWDRTRAIRRDFVFQSSMNPSELADQVYCLERITRFHVIALHQMSSDDVVAEDFSEQQEVEQLGKALLSLIHAYEDCNAQGITCENEAEFRAYYILFNSHSTGILETVQDWGWRFWGESDEIRIAVSLVEAMQNTWDTSGPLKPHSATDSSQNFYSRFFSIVEDRQVSYTMACFAEIHFNHVRKSVLKTILSSYRKQRDQTKDWSLTNLNTYLCFDDEEDIIPFGEAYGLRFDEIDGEVYLSFELGDTIADPFPPLHQRHSYSLVERKRGNYSLPAVIDTTVYEEGESEAGVDFDGEDGDEKEQKEEEETGLFVKDNNPQNGSGASIFRPEPAPANENDKEIGGQDPASVGPAKSVQMQETISKPTSLSVFGSATAPTTKFGSDFFTQKPTADTPLSQPAKPETSAFVFGNPATKLTSSAPTPTTAPSGGTTNSPFVPPFSLSSQTPPVQSSPLGSKPPLSLGPHTVPASPVPSGSPKSQFSLGDYAVTRPSEASAVTTPNQEVIAAPSKDNNPAVLSKNISQIPTPQYLSSGPPATASQQEQVSNAPRVQAEIPQDTPLPLAVEENKIGQATFSPKPPTFIDQKAKLSNFSNWFVTGDDGIIDQFTTFAVDQIAKNAWRIFKKEEAERIAREADALARQEADEFRYHSLATKYGRMWRDAAHRKWLKRKGREARRARQEMAESLRASKAALSASMVEDFRASTKRRRNSLESLLDATGILDGVHNSDEQIRAIVQDEIQKSEAERKRRRSRRVTDSSSTSTNQHKRGRSDNPLRRSLLSDPSYLNGGSRIHLMSNYGAQDEERRQVSGVQTDYFRLKARGITTLPNGMPLASSVANNTLHKKHSFDGINQPQPTTPKSSRQQPTPKSAPANNKQYEGPRSAARREDDIQILKARAKALIAEEETSRQRERKRSFDEGDDEELFARAKRVREQMDEGAQWFRKEIERSRSSTSGM